jgi:tRNA 2-thiouridine synthesizing protein A
MRVKADEILDLTGLKCPLPALLAKRKLRSARGKLIEIVADDPLAAIDLPHMCRQENIAVLHTERDGDVVRLWLQA